MPNASQRSSSSSRAAGSKLAVVVRVTAEPSAGQVNLAMWAGQGTRCSAATTASKTGNGDYGLPEAVAAARIATSRRSTVAVTSSK